MNRLFVTLQYLLPHHLLCRLAYALTRSRRVWLKNRLIGLFLHHYRPRMQEACEPEPLAYDSFNAFFTRELKPGLRPIDPHPARVVSPCDATVSTAGTLQGDQLLQAKGQRYDLGALLGADAGWTQRLQAGSYVTLYLAPSDYHRIHMPLAGRLLAAWHVPGRLFSVNASTAARVPGLYARNERVICGFEGEHGPFAVVLVGALFVGSMSTVWHGQITPWRARPARAAAGVRTLVPSTAAQPWQPGGAELGRFNMGSTVLLLLPAHSVVWNAACRPGNAVRVGQALGDLAGVDGGAGAREPR